MRHILNRPRLLFLLAEALVELIISSIMIALFSFRQIAEISTRRHHAAESASAELAQDIRYAVTAWARRVPWRALCFQQGLAAQRMLRRRKRLASLYYGARRESSGDLAAHVWVKSGHVEVMGCIDIESYGLLAVFPPE